jgi:hypothetical protein
VNLGRVDDAGADHVDVGFRLGVEAEGGAVVFEDLADHDRAFHAGALRDLTDRGLQRATNDGDAGNVFDQKLNGPGTAGVEGAIGY